jgi:hypothetical protein
VKPWAKIDPPEASNDAQTAEMSLDNHKNSFEKSIDNTEKGRVGSDEYLQLEGINGRPNEASLVKYGLAQARGTVNIFWTPSMRKILYIPLERKIRHSRHCIFLKSYFS